MEESEIRDELCSILNQLKAIRASLSVLTSVMMHDRAIDARQQIITDARGKWVEDE